MGRSAGLGFYAWSQNIEIIRHARQWAQKLDQHFSS